MQILKNPQNFLCNSYKKSVYVVNMMDHTFMTPTQNAQFLARPTPTLP